MTPQHATASPLRVLDKREAGFYRPSMQSSVASFPVTSKGAPRVAEARALPWFIYTVVFAAACIPIGALWDISWHSTIGRDSFWTPAHIMIYLGGALPGICCGWVVFKTSFFGSPEERAASVRYFGFQGPLGAWVTIWGSLTMLVSAPFDNWWHDAYGLDVEILSPPHTLLALGMYAVAVGATLLALSWQNRSTGARAVTAGRLFLFTMGVLLVMASIILTERSYPNAQHQGAFYKLCAVTYAAYLAMAARASRGRWGATIAAAIYMAIMCAMIWILPLFKAHPQLAPIYLQVDRMVPPVFPFILVAPAIFMDLIHQRLGASKTILADALCALCLGAAFLLVFVIVQWNFSAFLLSDSAKNWFFAGGQQWPYFIQGGEWRGRFWGQTSGEWLSFSSAIVALAMAIAAAFGGLFVGAWMRRVQR
jgi:hypothetical protein